MTGPQTQDEVAAVRAAAATRRRRWVLNAVGWDGAMPLAIAILPEVLVGLSLGKGQAELIVAGAVLATGLGRAHIGRRELERAGHASLPWWRQVLLAIAICLPMVVELTFGIILVIEREPLWPGVLIVLCEYLAYLAMILIALRPGRQAGPN